MDSFDTVDQHFMRRALELAQEAEGYTAPNPMVGAVVVSADGRIVGEGYHHAPGLAHAEVEALNQAGDQSVGATLYVNLEPCCHFGRTPPCSKKIIEHKLSRVVVGIADPNPKVAGGGLKELSEAGIDLTVGVLESECGYLNRGFFKAIKENLPWLSLKMALTLDGRIADRTAASRYVTGATARKFVMALRAAYDAVLIGANTARLDDPQLDVRIDDSDANRNPLRAVLDPNCTVKPEARIFAASGQTIIFCRQKELSRQSDYPPSASLVALPELNDGRLDCQAALQYLLERGCQKVLCEGGGQLAGSLIDAGLVDELYWFVAPKMLVDKEALPVVASANTRLMADSVEWQITGANFLGDDLLISALNPRHDVYTPV
ncbi:MAG: bifunctional diaminohydroxyphosphoribosylaminopyrimidine deaminase/5-amino-6-(5-phosphoribosylamino)uracil reductase RibD [Candidatus Obscuribacterales bacterium]